MQCAQLSVATYVDGTMRLDMETFPLSVLSVTSPQYTQFIRSSELVDGVRAGANRSISYPSQDQAFVEEYLHRTKKKIQRVLCVLSPPDISIGVPRDPTVKRTKEGSPTARMVQFVTKGKSFIV